MPRFHAAVEVHFKPGVFDPAGQAVARALTQLGHAGVGDVRVGKHVLLALEAADAAAAEREVDAMCRELLANPVIEAYRFQVVPAATGGAGAGRAPAGRHGSAVGTGAGVAASGGAWAGGAAAGAAGSAAPAAGGGRG